MEHRRISSRTVHDGRIVHLSVDRVRMPDGSVAEMERVRHAGAAAVLPIADQEEDPEILLVRQYRYATGETLLEVPAGLPDGPDEEWEACARRELEEETGWRAGSLERLTRIYTTPGFTDEVVHLFVARDLERGRAERDPDEFMDVERLRLSGALRKVRDGEIVDGKTVAALLFFDVFGRGAARP